MFQSIFTGLSGLIQHQRAIDNTAHNIANVNTEGFTKTRTNFSTNPSRNDGNVEIGTGVYTQSIERMHDALLFKKIKSSTSTNAQYNEESKNLSKLKDELLSSDLSAETLSDLLNNFFDSVERLSTDPNNDSIKTEVKNKGELFLKRADMLTSVFEDFKSRIEDEKDLLRTEAKDYQEQIKKLTKEINQIEAGNETTVVKTYVNDLRDQRDLLEEKLSKIGNFKSFEKVRSNDGNIDYGRDYNFVFDERGGRLQGLSNSVETVNKVQTLFQESLNTITPKVKDFLKNDMQNTNDILEWRYAESPVKKFNEAYIAISSYADSATAMNDTTESVLMAYENKRQMISRVNIDEEMTNMIRYQRAYEASAKVIQTSDEMLQTLLNIKS